MDRENDKGAERIKSDEYRAKMREYTDKKKITNKRYRDNHRKTPDNPEKVRTLKEQAKLLAGRAQKAAKKVHAALESGDVKCDALLLVFIGRYVERHEMNIRTGRNPRGSTPPEIFFEIIEAQTSHGDVAALKILPKKRNRAIAITLVKTQYCRKSSDQKLL